MAVRSVTTSNTLEQFRTTFNLLGTDVGDMASLSGNISATTVVGALNELQAEILAPTFTTSIVFEGATADAHETTVTVTDPTADRTITLPDESFTVASYKNLVTANGDGSTTTVTVSGNPGSANQLFVFLNGVSQLPGTDYSLSGTTLTFSTAPESGDKIVIRY
tara:strand:- start:986 stop:1477 length:492 start_codon:yes stop_codon:yes gene_type:complete